MVGGHDGGDRSDGQDDDEPDKDGGQVILVVEVALKDDLAYFAIHPLIRLSIRSAYRPLPGGESHCTRWVWGLLY